MSSYDGTILDDDISSDADIDPAKIKDTALVKTTVFAGMVTGVWDNLTIKSDVVTGAMIVDNTITDADIADDAQIGAKKIIEIDPQVNDAIGNNYVPLWNDSITHANPATPPGQLVQGHIYDDRDTGLIGIGTETPQEKVDVVGNVLASRYIDRENTNYWVDPASTSVVENIRIEGDIQITTGATDGYVLTSDAGGTGTWQKVALVEVDPQVGVNEDNYVPRWDANVANEGTTGALVKGVIYDPGTGKIGIGTESPGAYNLRVHDGDSDALMSLDSGGAYHVGLYFGSAGYTRGVIGYDQTHGIFKINAGAGLTGADHLCMKTDGKVGIGTAGPETILHHVGRDTAGGISQVTRVSDSGSGGTVNSELYRVGGLNAAMLRASAGGLGLYAGEFTSAKVYVQSGDGNVGIGTESPDSNVKLHVNGNFRTREMSFIGNSINEILQNSDDGGMWVNYYGYAGGTTRHRDFWVGNGKQSAVMKVDGSSGRVGIGTTSPQYSLDVRGAARLNALRFFNLGDVESGNYEEARMLFSGNVFYIQSLAGGSGTTRDMQFGDTSGNVWLRLKSGGNVGIGTTSPEAGAKLDVVSTSTGRIRVSGRGSGYTQADILLQTGTTDSPAARGTGIYTHNQGNNVNWFFGNPYASSDRFMIARKTGSFAESTAETGNSLLTILNSGDVGIGIGAPAYKLHVGGNARIAGTLYADPISSGAGEPFLNLKGASGRTVLVPNAAGFRVTDATGRENNMELVDSGDLYLRQYLHEGSDSRGKLNQEELDYGMDEIMELNPVRFLHVLWSINQETGEVEIEEGSGTNDIGLVAQEVYEVIPEAASKPEDESKGMWTLAYSKITTVLVKAFQEQHELLDQQQQKIEDQQEQIDDLLERIVALEQK